ncbi:Transferase family [Cylindrospermum stagnale PCC 7417]|uniref:Transferase family n=1 Tax=Cylindrospermum stagnale PCC 7417 TaxID=56107 RepID=K9WWI0_9NOST|nr:acyltransferase [Cylindrospermum stagnale]AFZ24136.1 Transferase family [Cylindrospermum stagnale PCC 7417]
MKSETFLVQVNNHNRQLITCSFTDQLIRNIYVSLIFFYRTSVDSDLLIDALQQTLSDFPIFAGVLINTDNNLYIDCNNKGVLFSIRKDDFTLDRVIKELPKVNQKRLVNIIDPKKAILTQSPVMTIQLTYFACGGMTLGVCWHHSIGDMQSFMCFMKAWANKFRKEEYPLPLIVKDRDKYSETNLKKNSNSIPGVRYLNRIELLKTVFCILLGACSRTNLQFYFSENELKNMKQDFLEKTNQNISKNDVLCAYIFKMISDLDVYKEKRYLSIVVDYRRRVKIPLNILGNYVTNLNTMIHQKVDPYKLAQTLRESLDNFQKQHLDFFSTKEYIERNGGIEKIAQFVPIPIDPLRRNLLISNWTNFGVYNVRFDESYPFFFTSFGDDKIPWLSKIINGFSNNGFIYSVSLPNKLAKKLIEEDNLRKIHKYRHQEEIMPELVEKLEWLL